MAVSPSNSTPSIHDYDAEFGGLVSDGVTIHWAVQKSSLSTWKIHIF